MAVTDQKHGPDLLTHQSVTVTDDPPCSPRQVASQPRRDDTVSAPPRLLLSAENRCDNDRNNIIERQGPQATVP